MSTIPFHCFLTASAELVATSVRVVRDGQAAFGVLAFLHARVDGGLVRFAHPFLAIAVVAFQAIAGRTLVHDHRIRTLCRRFLLAASAELVARSVSVVRDANALAGA
jgi:hypothetical protein